MNKRLRFFEKDTVDWKGKSLAPFYRSVFALKDSQPALANGSSGGMQSRVEIELTDFKDHLRDDNRLYAFAREKDANLVVVVVNFGDTLASLSVPDAKWAGSYRDVFDRSQAAVLGRQGDYLRVPAHGYRILVKEGRIQ